MFNVVEFGTSVLKVAYKTDEHEGTFEQNSAED